MGRNLPNVAPEAKNTATAAIVIPLKVIIFGFIDLFYGSNK